MRNSIYRGALIYKMKWRIKAIKLAFFSPSPLFPTLLISKKSTIWIIEAEGNFFFPWIIQEIASIFLSAPSCSYLCRVRPRLHNEAPLSIMQSTRYFFSLVLIFQLIVWCFTVSTIYWSDFLRKRESAAGLILLVFPLWALATWVRWLRFTKFSPTNMFLWYRYKVGLVICTRAGCSFNSGEKWVGAY